MKKIFTLVFVVGTFTMAQAQYGTRDSRQTDQRNNQPTDQRDVNRDFDNRNEVVVDINAYDRDGRYNNNNSFDRNMRMQIARINQEYDYKTQRVMRNYFMSRYEKQRQLRFLQEQRQREISMVYAKFNDRRGRGNGRDGRDGRDDRDDHPYHY